MYIRDGMKNSITLVYSLFTIAVLVFTFSLIRNMGYSHMIELRLLNALFMTVGIAMGINMVKRSFPKKFNYTEGLKVGFSITLLSVSVYSVFVYMVAILDDSFLLKIVENESSLRFLNPELLSIFNLVEGASLGLVLTIGIMQFQRGSFLRRIFDRIA